MRWPVCLLAISSNVLQLSAEILRIAHYQEFRPNVQFRLQCARYPIGARVGPWSRLPDLVHLRVEGVDYAKSDLFQAFRNDRSHSKAFC